MKIVEFSQNMQQLKNRCETSFRAGDFLLCLKYAFLAIENVSDFAFYPIIADCYYKLGAYECSLEWYCKALADKANKIRCFIGISRCYMELNKLELAFLYINNAIRLDKSNKYLNEIQNVAMYLQTDKIAQRMKSQQAPFVEVNKKQLEKAKHFMVNGKYEEAKNAVKEISPNSRSYCEATNLHATIELLQDNLIQAQELANKVLEINKNDINALCTIALVFSATGNKVSSMGAIKTAMAIKNVSFKEKFMIATTLCQLNAHKLGIIYLKEILKANKYHYDFLILLATAYNNNKEYNNALKTIDFCLDIYRFDTFCLSLKNKILQCQINEGLIPYVNQIYQHDERNALLYKIEHSMFAKDAMVVEYCSKQRNKELIIWGLKTFLNKFADNTIFCLVRANCTDFIKELLLSTRVTANVKVMLVKELVIQNKLEKMPIMFESLFAELNLKKIKEKMENKDFHEVFLDAMGLKIIN